MFKALFRKTPKVERRKGRCEGEACDHPSRRDDDYACAVAQGLTEIREAATAAAEGLEKVAERLAKQRVA